MAINGDNNIKANLKAKYAEILKDKQVTQKELDKLTPAEQEALIKALTNEDGTIKEGFTIEGKLGTQPVVEEKKGWFKKNYENVKNWFKDPEVPVWKKALAGVGCAAAGVVGTVAVVAFPKLAIAGAAAAVATGCTVEMEQNMHLDIKTLDKINENSSNEDLIKAIEHFTDKVNGTINELIDKLNNIYGSLEKVLAKLGEIGMLSEDILLELINLGVKLDSFAIDVGNKLNENNQTQKEIRDKLDIIINKIQEGNDIGNENNKLLAKILVKLDNLEPEDTNTEELLNKILSQLTGFVEQEKTADQKTYDLLNKILEKINSAPSGGLDPATNDLLNKILEVNNKILNELQGMKDYMPEVTAYLEALLNGQKTQGEALRDLIKQVVGDVINTIKDGNKELGEKLGKKLDDILAKIPDGCKCDPTQILAKLEIIITELQNGNEDDPRHEGILDDLEDLLG